MIVVCQWLGNVIYYSMQYIAFMLLCVELEVKVRIFGIV